MRPEHLATHLDTAAKQAAADIVDGDDPHTIAIDLIAACERTVTELRAHTDPTARAQENAAPWAMWIIAAILGVADCVGQATTGQPVGAMISAGIIALFTAAMILAIRGR